MLIGFGWLLLGPGAFPNPAGILSTRLCLAGADAPPPRTNPPPGAVGREREEVHLSALDVIQAWDRLPAAAEGAGQPLPVWARTLARGLPRTTAAMLELDYLQRERSPLPPLLRGQLRWAAAHANRCAYGEAYALADLRRAGMDETGIKALTQDQAGLPAKERAALAFARKLTLAASTVSDAEVSQLLELYGDKRVVAMVLLLAYANFQDRLLLALDLAVEEGGPLPPLKVRFTEKPPTEGREAVPRTQPDPWVEKPRRKQAADPDWPALDYSQLQKGLEKQRARRPRINLPAGRPEQIQWGAVCRTYQPELAAAWSACTHAFDVEADQDPVFQQSVFWVITRSEQCFY
jgi:alkylhydroperoxidase family enzyme